MKNLIVSIALMISLNSCGRHGKKHGSGHGEGHDPVTLTSPSNITPGLPTNFPTIGFEQTHEVEIPFSIDEVFPLYNPESRNLVYSWWNPTILREANKGTLEGQATVTEVDGLEVFLSVTAYNQDKKHIQYLVLWGDFELQRIDITCKEGTTRNSTKVVWTERNAGINESGVSMVSEFVKGENIPKIVERYAKGIEDYLKNKKEEKPQD